MQQDDGIRVQKKAYEFFFIFPLVKLTSEMIYYATVRPTGAKLRKRTSIFENWKLEIKENYNSYTRSMAARPSKRGNNFLLSVYGRTTDALASGGDEGRGRLR